MRSHQNDTNYDFIDKLKIYIRIMNLRRWQISEIFGYWVIDVEHHKNGGNLTEKYFDEQL